MGNNQLAVKVEIVKYIDDSFPGWVECKLIDAWGELCFFETKVPIVSHQSIDQNSKFPQDGEIGCESQKRWRDENGREIVTIDTEKPWDIESRDRRCRFDVLPVQLINLDPQNKTSNQDNYS